MEIELSLILSIIGLILTIILGVVPIIVSFKRKEMCFSKRFPFLIIPITDDSVSTPGKEVVKKKSVRRILIPLSVLASLIIAFLIIKLFLFQEVTASRQTSVAVILFENETGDNSLDYLGEAIPNLLITNLEQSKYLSVMTWERMYDLLKVIGKENVKTIDKELAFEICQKDGIEAVVVGSFIKTGDMFAIDAKVLDVESKKLLQSYSTKGEGVVSILKEQIDQISKFVARGIGLSERKTKQTQSIAEVTTSSMDAYKYYLQARDAYDKLYFDDVVKFAQQAITLDTTFAAVYLYQAMADGALNNILERNRDFEKAKSYSEKTSEKERFYIDAYYYGYIKKDTKKQLTILKLLAKKYPKEKQVGFDLGNYYYKQGLYKQGIKFLNKALQLDANYGAAMNLIAYCYIGLGNYERAIEYFKKYAMVAPNDANPFDSMADLYFRIGRINEATLNYQKALSIKPDFGSDRRLAYIYALKEDYEQVMNCIDHYITASQSPGVKNDGLWWKAFYDYWQGNLTKSAIELKQWQDYWKYDGDLLAGFICLEQGNYTRGRQNFEEYFYTLIEVYPEQENDFTVLYNFLLSLVDLKQGKPDSVRFRLEIMKSIIPDISPANKDLFAYYPDILYTELLFSVDSLDKAIVFSQKIKLPEIPDFRTIMFYNLPFLRDVLARSYEKKGEVYKAIQEYERMITFDPNSKDRRLIHPLYHYRLAKLYEQKGLTTKALEQYNKFLSIDNDADPKIPELIDAKTSAAKITVK